MYMFHEIAIKIVMETQTRISGTRFEGLSSNAILYAGSILLTVIIATAAWRYYERWFLRLKSRFTIVRSGPDVAAMNPS
jgi:peptidoglycan/LPS O-acetylase OafA/YrhL